MVQMRGATAVLAIDGPIFRYANLMTAMSGATSVEMAAQAFDQALHAATVARIVLAINSPGGEVDGINSFADQIRAGAQVKPVTAFIDGTGASAAYWLASAASNIVADESSLIGSIGVVASVTDRTQAQERQGVRTFKFISSQSPKKHATPDSAEGQTQLQEMVDAMAGLFIGKVAAFRGVSPETVMSDFGQGKVMTAADARQAGMIDRISGFEPFLARLESEPPRVFVPAAAAATKEVAMATMPAALPALPAASPPVAPNPETIPAAALAPVVSIDLAAQERQRIRGILSLPEAQGREALARVLAFDTDHDAATAQKILAAAPATAPPAQPATSFEREMQRIPNPVVGAASGSEADSAEAEAGRVLNFVTKERKFGS
jgi:signal peptide peptidase SppA